MCDVKLSTQVAELTGKRHDHVLRDIDREIKALELLGTPEALEILKGFEKTSYKDTQGKERKCYRLDTSAQAYMAMLYCPKARCTIAKSCGGFNGELLSRAPLKPAKIYILKECASGRYKVGVSQDPDKRLKTLQIGNPKILQIVWSSPPCTNAITIEKAFHSRFAHSCIRGEWFKANVNLSDIVEYIMNSISESLSNETINP